MALAIPELVAEIAAEIPEDLAVLRRAYNAGRFDDIARVYRDAAKWTGRASTVYSVGLIAKGMYHTAKKAGKSFSAAHKAAQSTMKSWRKRMADFGQWERRVKRRTLKTLGRKYRTTAPAKKTMPVMHTSLGTKFSRSKGVKRTTKYIQMARKEYGAVQRTHSIYARFQTHGSTVYLTEALAAAILRAVFARLNMYPRSFSDVMIPVAASREDLYRVLVFDYRSIDDDNGVETLQGTVIDIENKSFREIVQSFGADIDSKLNSGYFPTACQVFKHFDAQTGGTDVRMHRFEYLEEGKFTYMVKQIVRIQNLTPNDANTTNLDVTGQNPISGRIYEFTSQPLLQGGLTDENGALESSFQSHASSTNGITVLPDTSMTQVDGILSHPPPPFQLFKNCRKSAIVKIDAGGNKYKTTYYKFSGNLIDFVKRFGDMDNARHLGGGSLMFGFNNAFRAGIDIVKIGFNRDCYMRSRYDFGRKHTVLREFNETDMTDTI